MGKPVISASHLNKTLKRRLSALKWTSETVVSDFSADFEAGIIYGIVGLSGSGKTTLANILAGYTEPDTGRVMYSGVDIYGNGRKKIRKKFDTIRNIFQDTYRALNPLNTVSWYIERAKSGNKDGFDPEFVMERLGMSIDEYGKISVDRLSGGERQRLAFAIVAIQRPLGIIMDEPFSMIDSVNAMSILSFIREYMHKSSVIYIDHNVDRVMYLSDFVIFINEGRIVEEGFIDDIATKQNSVFARSLVEKQRTISKFTDLNAGKS